MSDLLLETLLSQNPTQVIQALREHCAALRITAFLRSRNRLMQTVVSAAREVAQILSWGWNEKAYQEALKIELGLRFQQQQQLLHITSEVPHTVHYKGYPMGDGVNVRTDLLISRVASEKAPPTPCLLLELKADAATPKARERAKQQCCRYLKLAAFQHQDMLGMVIHFPTAPGEDIKMCRVDGTPATRRATPEAEATASTRGGTPLEVVPSEPQQQADPRRPTAWTS